MGAGRGTLQLLDWAAFIALHVSQQEQKQLADCGICPALEEDIALFLGPSVPDYVEFVSQYRNESAVLKNAENLKTCVDNKLTAEDKENVKSLVAKIDANPLC
ncbi:hypothetical protein ACRRTK_000484 [Alexandromys fortis]